jgi:hypothetical protein
MSESTNLALPFLTQGQAQKHVTVNESLLRLDAVVHLSVVSATTSAQPASPADGQVYILPAGKTGTNWGAMTNYALAYYRDGVWEEIAPREGWLAFIKDTDKLCYYTGSAWALFPAAKLLTLSATDKIIGRVSSGAGDAEEVSFTDQAQQLCDDTSFSAMRTTMGAAGLADANIFSAPQVVQVASGTPLTLQLDDDGAGLGPVLNLYRNSNSPAANDLIGGVQFSGKDSAGATTTYAQIRGIVTDPTDGSEDVAIDFRNIVAGSLGVRLLVGAGLYHGSATGGDKGNNTINFGAVYDDNTLLTCGPLELLREGAVDLAKWDALTPNILHPAVTEDIIEEEEREIAEAFHVEDQDGARHSLKRRRKVKAPRVVGQRMVREAYVEERRHEVMHRFAAMVSDGFDPRDPDNFCARMKADGAVPGLMTEAEWREMAERGEKPDIGTATTRIFLALDNLAVAFAGAMDRIKALEAKRAPRA